MTADTVPGEMPKEIWAWPSRDDPHAGQWLDFGATDSLSRYIRADLALRGDNSIIVDGLAVGENNVRYWREHIAELESALRGDTARRAWGNSLADRIEWDGGLARDIEKDVIAYLRDSQ